MQRPLQGWLPEMCKHCGSLTLLNIALFVWVAWYVNFWLKQWRELKCKMVAGLFFQLVFVTLIGQNYKFWIWFVKWGKWIGSQSALFYFLTVFAEPQISAEWYFFRRTDFFKLDIGLFTVIVGIMAAPLFPLLLCYELWCLVGHKYAAQ